MPMRLVLSILGVFFILPVFSQVKEYGSVSVADLQQIASAGDTTSAIILFDKGSAVLEPNSTSGTVVKRHMRLKIIRKGALREWGDFKFTISREAQLKVKGATYNLENGVVVKSQLEDKAILKSRFDKNFDQITFAFPNVREGSILEFTSTYKNPDLMVPSWDFQYSIPVKWSEYSVSIPVKGLISYLSGGLTPTEHESKYEGEFQRWLMKDVPAFTYEPSMPNEDVYKAGVDFAVRFNSWPAIYSREQTRLFKKQGGGDHERIHGPEAKNKNNFKFC